MKRDCIELLGILVFVAALCIFPIIMLLALIGGVRKMDEMILAVKEFYVQLWGNFVETK